MKVEQIMSQPVATCSEHDSAQRAAQLMWEQDCGCVPVVDREQRPIGMITDRDLCMAAYTQSKPLYEIRVSDVMSREVSSCRAKDLVRSAHATMRSKQVRRLPVLNDDGQVIGVISLNDIALEAQRERTHSRKEVSHNDVALTLESISQHRTHEALAVQAAQ